MEYTHPRVALPTVPCLFLCVCTDAGPFHILTHFQIKVVDNLAGWDVAALLVCLKLPCLPLMVVLVDTQKPKCPFSSTNVEVADFCHTTLWQRGSTGIVATARIKLKPESYGMLTENQPPPRFAFTAQSRTSQGGLSPLWMWISLPLSLQTTVKPHLHFNFSVGPTFVFNLIRLQSSMNLNLSFMFLLLARY